MSFAELMGQVLAKDASCVRRNLLGTLEDLFGDCTVEDMTPLLIEEKLRGAVRAWKTGGLLSKGAVSTYRSALRRIFERALKMGAVRSNPVPSGTNRNIMRQVERLLAIELLKKVENQLPSKYGEGGGRLRREAVSLVERGNPHNPELAKVIRALFGLGSGQGSGPRTERTKEAYRLAVLFAAKDPPPSARAIARHCGVDIHEVLKWLKTEQFMRAVRVERHEIPTEGEIRALRSAERRSRAKRTDDATRDIVRTRHPHEPTSAIAADLGVSVASIFHLAGRLGLRKTKKRMSEASKALWTPQRRKKHARYMRKYWTKRRRAQRRRRQKERWKGHKYRNAVTIAMRARPRDDRGRLLPKPQFADVGTV